MSILLKDGKNTQKVYSTITGKPIIQIRYKHEHRYLIYQEIAQNILDADLSFVDDALRELKHMCERRGYSIYDFNDMQSQLLAHSKTIPQDGREYVVVVNIRDLMSGDVKQVEFAMIGDPTADEDAPIGVVE